MHRRCGMKYFVRASGGLGFASPGDALKILESIVLPGFDALMKLEGEKKILGGGLPVVERALVFIMEASSNEELDEALRKIPMWGAGLGGDAAYFLWSPGRRRAPGSQGILKKSIDAKGCER
jgi:hypothetical protein